MIGGFSGYLCELLIIKYGSFAQTIQAFAHYNRRVVTDIEGFYVGREKELSLLFPERLVIVDPVDKGRNVASAVQPQKLYTFIAAARTFLGKPAEEFFYPPKGPILSQGALKSQLAHRSSAVIFLVIGGLDAVPDVLWGQLYRSKRSLRTLIELNDFKVLRDEVWSNGKSLSIFMFEVEQQVLANVKKHLGPPLEREVECKAFLAKYADIAQVVSGPYIEGGRWMVMLPRKTTDAVSLLKAKLEDGGKDSGVAGLITNAMKKNLKVLVNAEVLEVYNGNRDFAVFLTDYLSGKPFWLKAQ
jgi:tRNA nucleotidyltransferase (CCA-adding enzyme)